MIKLSDEYVNAIAPTANYPGGSFKNETIVGADDGTPVEKKWANDLLGFSEALIAAAGIVVSGAPDTALASDRFDALMILLKQFGHDTGDWKLTIATAPTVGWVMLDGGTIGSATSGASNRANADCEALFKLLWNNISQTYAPVTGGRGASANADWTANKKIKLTTSLGRALVVAGTGVGLTNRVLGSTFGSETHTLTVNQLPIHDHDFTYPANPNGNSGGSHGAMGYTDFMTTATNTESVSTTNTSAVQSIGGDQAHNNMQPSVAINVMMKL